jgi:hypothetical protein
MPWYDNVVTTIGRAVRSGMVHEQNKSGQNVLATKRIGTKRIGPKRIAYKTYQRQNVSADKTYQLQNESAT